MTKKELKRRLLVSVENMSKTISKDQFLNGTMMAYIDVLVMLGYNRAELDYSSKRLIEIDKLDNK